jgi:hypothetical protein
MNLKEMRPGNRRAFDLILERLRDSKPTTSIVKPTRYGKRDLIITSCFQAVEDNIVSGGIVFSPASQATRQFFKEKKLGQTITRYEMPFRDVMGGIRQLSSFSEYQPFSNGEFLLAANIQLCLRTNIEDCIVLIDAERYRTGKPLVVFIDECQFVSEKKRWGEFFMRVQRAGVLLVLLTATAYREDADAIPGFRYTQIKENDERRFFVYDAGDGIHNKIDVWDGVRTLSQLEADDVTTFSEAWEHQPTVLCKLDREIVSVDVDGKPLSDLNVAETRKCLGKIVRDQRFLDPAIRLLLRKLETVQNIDPHCKAMIVTGSDQPNDRRDNAHAETIKRLLANIAPIIIGRQCKVKVITMKSDLEDDSLATLMEEFLEGDEDIVIVKQAGTVGLDDWRIKVLGYFTPIRSVATMIQTWMRPATPEGGLQIAHLIMPDDRFSTAVWSKLIIEEGGEAKLSEMSGWAAEDFINSYLKKKEQAPEPPELPFGPGAISGFDDSRGNIGSLEFYEEATRIFQHLPRIAEVYTKAEVAVVLKQSGHTPTGSPQAVMWGLDQQLENLYAQINESSNEKTNLFMMRQAGQYDRELYETIRTQIFTFAYRMVNLRIGVKLKQVKNLQTLSRIKTVIDGLNEIPND